MRDRPPHSGARAVDERVRRSSSPGPPAPVSVTVGERRRQRRPTCIPRRPWGLECQAWRPAVAQQGPNSFSPIHRRPCVPRGRPSELQGFFYRAPREASHGSRPPVRGGRASVTASPLPLQGLWHGVVTRRDPGRREVAPMPVRKSPTIQHAILGTDRHTQQQFKMRHVALPSRRADDERSRRRRAQQPPPIPRALRSK